MTPAEKKAVLSPQSEKDIREAIIKIKEDLRLAMKFSDVTHLRISIDCMVESACPFMGVKINASRFENQEIIYDHES